MLKKIIHLMSDNGPFWFNQISRNSVEIVWWFHLMYKTKRKCIFCCYYEHLFMLFIFGLWASHFCDKEIRSEQKLFLEMTILLMPMICWWECWSKSKASKDSKRILSHYSCRLFFTQLNYTCWTRVFGVKHYVAHI